MSVQRPHGGRVLPLLFERFEVALELVLLVADLQELEAELVEVLAERVEDAELDVFEVLAETGEELLVAHLVDLAVQLFVGVAELEQVFDGLDELLDDDAGVFHERRRDPADAFSPRSPPR